MTFPPPEKLSRAVLDHYPAVRGAFDPFVPSPSIRTSIGGIPGLTSTILGWIPDARGALVEVFRSSRAEPIGQAYVSVTTPGTIKAWHLHAEPDGEVDPARAQVDRFFALRGRTLLVFFDLRPTAVVPGRFVEFVADAARVPSFVEVPPGVAHGWLALGPGDSEILNLPTRSYDGRQERRCDPHGPVYPGGPTYEWRRSRDG